MTAYDVVVCGAGPTGCTLAERAAYKGYSVLVVDRRDHIAGNCYDYIHDDTGLLVHAYGPHYMRFTDRSTFDYVSSFTSWLPGNYHVRANVGGRLLPIPINLETLELFFDRAPLDPASAESLLESERIPVEVPQNSEEFVISRVGFRLYEALYKGYTEKQWGVPAAELAPSVCGRVPIRLNRDSRYVDAEWQVMPKGGYTSLFGAMLSSPRIDVSLQTDWLHDRVTGSKATYFTGPLDEYFDHAHGPLPWRSLRFEWSTHDQEWVQPCVQVNHPGPEPYTRTVEFKHVTRQQSSKSVLCTEYPESSGDPYYPVPLAAGNDLFGRYRSMVEAETDKRGVWFVGRLATYRYVNMDEAIREALVVASQSL